MAGASINIQHDKNKGRQYVSCIDNFRIFLLITFIRYYHSMWIVNCEFFILFVCLFFCFQSIFPYAKEDVFNRHIHQIQTMYFYSNCLLFAGRLLFVFYLFFCVFFLFLWNVIFHEEHKEHEEQHNRAINANDFGVGKCQHECYSWAA